MIKRYFRVIKAEVIMNLKDTFSYRVGIVSDIIVMIILYFACLFMNGYQSIGEYYSVGESASKSMVLQGYIYWSFSVLILGSMSNTIRMDAIKGTLEQKAMSVVPLQFLLLGDFLSSLLVNVIIVISVCIISNLFLGTTIFMNLMTIVTLVLTLVGMYGMSLIFGGIALVSKRINNLVYIIQLILLIASNAVYQVDGINLARQVLPISLGIDIGRKYVVGQSVSVMQILLFVIINLIWLVVGSAIFEFFLKKSKKRGILSQY